MTTGASTLENKAVENGAQSGKRPAAARGLWKNVGAVVLIFVIGIGLRFNGITFDSMWLDEAYQTMVDSVGVKPENLEKLHTEPFVYDLGKPNSTDTVLSNFRQVDPLCPPLYFLMLNRWMSAFGTGDLAVRSLSALTSILALCALYFGTRKMFGANVALMTLLLQAVSPFDITYAQEARMYALVTLTSTVSCLSYYALMQAAKGKSHWSGRLGLIALYGASTWAMINSHYTGLCVVAFQGLFGTFYSLKNRSLPMFLHLAAGWALVCLFWLPWFDLFRQAASGRSNFYVSRTSGIGWTLKGLSKIPLNWVSFMSGGRIAAFAIPIYATALGLILTCAYVSLPDNARNWLQSKIRFLPHGEPGSAESDSVRERNRDALLYVWCWALVPALIALTLDILESRKTIEVARYLIGTAPAVFILAGFGARKLVAQKGLALWVVALHVLFATANYAYAKTTPQREPWRQMAELIELRVPTSDLVLISPHYDLICLNRYLTKPRMQVGTGPLLGNEHVYSVLENRKRFWLITAQEGSSVTVFVPPRFQQKETIKLKHSLELTYWEDNQ